MVWLNCTIPGVAATSPDKPFKQKLLPVSVAYDAGGNVESYESAGVTYSFDYDLRNRALQVS